jgi:tocopherol O-methyltransferase
MIRQEVFEGLSEFVDAGDDLRHWYEGKTAALLEKYQGQKGRIHYHIGPVDLGDAVPLQTLREVKDALWESQEAELSFAFEHWRRSFSLGGRALDVGCGLGGSMLWLLAHDLFEHVDGLTIAASHKPIIERIAAFERLQRRVDVIVGDANTWLEPRAYDTIYSVQAGCLFDRERWFPRVAHMLREGGLFLLDDYLLADASLKAHFDATYAGNAGGREEYVELAAVNGLTLVDEVDLTLKTADFWELCALYAELSANSREGWHQSANFHRAMRAAQCARHYEHRLFAFARV